MANPMVEWEKWVNPLGLQLKDEDGLNVDTEEFIDEDDEQEFDDTVDWQQTVMKAQPFVMITPVGPVPLNVSNNPINFFNYWICHTNFPVSRPLYDGIEKVIGVETLDYFSAYRLRVGIAPLCDGKIVRSSVTDYLVKSVKNEPNKKDIS